MVPFTQHIEKAKCELHRNPELPVKPEDWVSEEEMTFESPLFMLLPAPS